MHVCIQQLLDDYLQKLIQEDSIAEAKRVKIAIQNLEDYDYQAIVAAAAELDRIGTDKSRLIAERLRALSVM